MCLPRHLASTTSASSPDSRVRETRPSWMSWGLHEISVHCPYGTGCVVELNERWFPSCMARRYFWWKRTIRGWWEAHCPCAYRSSCTQRALNPREVASGSQGSSASPETQSEQISSTRLMLSSGILALNLFSCIQSLNSGLLSTHLCQAQEYTQWCLNHRGNTPALRDLTLSQGWRMSR